LPPTRKDEINQAHEKGNPMPNRQRKRPPTVLSQWLADGTFAVALAAAVLYWILG
jgi:hypothetical protein